MVDSTSKPALSTRCNRRLWVVFKYLTTNKQASANYIVSHASIFGVLNYLVFLFKCDERPHCGWPKLLPGSMSVDTFHMFPHSNYCHSGSSSNKSDSVEKLFLPGTKAAFAVFFLILCIAQVATSSLLIHGARKVAAEEDKLLINFDRFARETPVWLRHGSLWPRSAWSKIWSKWSEWSSGHRWCHQTPASCMTSPCSSQSLATLVSSFLQLRSTSSSSSGLSGFGFT